MILARPSASDCSHFAPPPAIKKKAAKSAAVPGIRAIDPDATIKENDRTLSIAIAAITPLPCFP
jgi:hypothetical protein